MAALRMHHEDIVNIFHNYLDELRVSLDCLHHHQDHMDHLLCVPLQQQADTTEMNCRVLKRQLIKDFLNKYFSKVRTVSHFP